MHRFLLAMVMFAITIKSASAEDVILFKKEQTGYKKIFVIKDKQYLVTADAIYIISKKEIKQQIKLSAGCFDACVHQNMLLLATSDGLEEFDGKKNEVKKIALVKGKTEHVAVDAQNNIWFTKQFEGGFKIQDSLVLQIINAPAVYSLATTRDGNVWIGTNVGLYKVSLIQNRIFRFVEEGIEGFELPDNLVENLYADSASNIWAVMPGDISFISSNGEDEIPDYSYVGSRQNKVLDICKTPLAARSYLFATNEGLICTGNLKGDAFNHTGEIHQEFYEPAIYLNDSLIDRPEVLKKEVVNAIQVCGKHVVFITNKGLWKLNIKKLESRITNKFSLHG